MKLLETLTHWFIVFAPGLLLIVGTLFVYICLNILLWPVIFIYCAYILLYSPSEIEINTWKYILESTKRALFNILPIADYQDAFQIKGTLSEQPAIYTVHPHGLIATSPWVHRFNYHSPYWKVFTHHQVAVHSFLFKLPIIRELLLYAGAIPANKTHIEATLDKGIPVWIVVGGTRDAVHSKRGEEERDTWEVKSHTGFLKIAQKKNVPIIPVYIEGEQTLLTYIYNFDWIDEIITYFTGYRFNMNLLLQSILPHNLYKWWSIGNDLHKKQTTTHIGLPFLMKEGEESIEDLQARYIQHIQELYTSSESSNKILTIV